MLYIIITFAEVTLSRHKRQGKKQDCRNGFVCGCNLPELTHKKELTKTTRHGQLFRTFTRTPSPRQQQAPPLSSSPPQGGQFGDLQAQLAERAEEAQDNIKGALRRTVDTGCPGCRRLHSRKLHIAAPRRQTKLYIINTVINRHTIKLIRIPDKRKPPHNVRVCAFLGGMQKKTARPMKHNADKGMQSFYILFRVQRQ